MRRILLLVVAVILATGWPPAHGAPVEKVIPYTMVTQLSYPGAYKFRFSLWDAETGGTRVFAEVKSLKLASSRLTTDLGSGRQGRLSGIDFSQQYWVQTEVYRASLARFVSLDKRIRLASAAYSFWSPQDPIVVTQNPNFIRFSTATTPTLMIPVGHVFGASADNGIIIMGLTAPTSVGGVTYQLGAVEWCLGSDTTNSAVVTTALVYHDAPGASGSPFATAVSDTIDRTLAGCYTLVVPPLSARGYSLALALTGQTTNLTQAGVVLSGVRTTWVAVP